MAYRRNSDDWGFIHPECAPEPGRYKDVPVSAFYGRDVQLAFPAPTRKERMWVRVTGPAETPGQELQGFVNQDPVFALDWPDRTPLEFLREEIIKVDIIDLPPSPYQDNPDREYRDAERRGAQGDVEQQAKALNLRVRRGDLERWRLGTLAHLNYTPALVLLDTKRTIGLDIKKWWSKLTHVIPDTHTPLRFEIRFRTAFAAIRATLHVIQSIQPYEFKGYIESVLDLFEGAFLESIYDDSYPESDYYQELDMNIGVIQEALLARTTTAIHEASPELTTQMYARALHRLLSAIRTHYINEDTDTIYPHAHPNAQMYELLRQMHLMYPVGMGGIEKEIAKELTPWLLKEYDPILERSRPPHWTGNEIRLDSY